MNPEQAREIEEKKLTFDNLGKVTPEEDDFIIEAEDDTFKIQDHSKYLGKDTEVKNHKATRDQIVIDETEQLKNQNAPDMDTLAEEADELTKKHNAKKLS